MINFILTIYNLHYNKSLWNSCLKRCHYHISKRKLKNLYSIRILPTEFLSKILWQDILDFVSIQKSIPFPQHPLLIRILLGATQIKNWKVIANRVWRIFKSEYLYFRVIITFLWPIKPYRVGSSQTPIITITNQMYITYSTSNLLGVIWNVSKKCKWLEKTLLSNEYFKETCHCMK